MHICVIQKAGVNDIQALSNLIRLSNQDVAQAFHLTKQNCPKHPSNCRDEWVESDFARGVTYYLLSDKGIPVGCAALEKADSGIGYLERVAVLPQFRHHGLGAKLVHHILDIAKKMNLKTISIGIIAEQQVLREWYETLGFVLVDTKKFAHLPFQVGFMKIDL